MLPDNLVPAKFHISTVEPKPPEAESNENFTKGKRTLADYAPDILIGVTRTGNSRNMLLEEHDRHIKDRLFRVVKILTEKTDEINEAGNDIWLNLITCEKNTPIFYKLEDE